MSYLCQWTMHYFTNLATDVITNTFHMAWGASENNPNAHTPEPTSNDFAALESLLTSFYNGVYTSTHSLASYVNHHNTDLKIYRLEDVKPRLPKHQHVGFSFNPHRNAQGEDHNQPPEIACVLSIHDAPLAGVPRGRQRGRIYLGGLGGNWLGDGDESAFPVIIESTRASVCAAANNLRTGVQDAGWQWIVYSKTQGLSFDVSGGYVDDAVDIQRRRGQAPSVRTTFGS